MGFRFCFVGCVLLASGCYQSVDVNLLGGDLYRSSDTDLGAGNTDRGTAVSSDSESESEFPPMETVCNGMDDDGNHIVDDVDQNGDGICDCLKISVLGNPGEYGEGDVFETWLSNHSMMDICYFYGRLDEAILNEYHVLIVQDITLFPQEDAAVLFLKRWVHRGGGLMTLSGFHGDATEIENVNQLLSPFGLSYGATDVMGEETSVSTPVTEWLDHPIAEGITQVGMKYGRPVDGGGEIVATGKGPLDTQTSVLGRTTQAGSGRVFAWADEWTTYESEWVDRPEYQVQQFWRNTLKWLAGEKLCHIEIADDSAQ